MTLRHVKTPPGMCLFCGVAGSFKSREHIVPESMGNDVVVLAPGWVCDECNVAFSATENRALSRSFWGLERARLGVITKKGKPAIAKLGRVTYSALPHRPNTVLAEVHKAGPLMVWKDSSRTEAQAFIPFEREMAVDMSRVLLKMGIELVSVHSWTSTGRFPDCLDDAKTFALKGEGLDWPMMILADVTIESRLRSLLLQDQMAWREARACSFDLFLHEIDSELVFFFRYGSFIYAVPLRERSTSWTKQLEQWGARFLAAPGPYAALSWPKDSVEPADETMPKALKETT